MTTVPENHYDAAQYYAGLALLPIPSEHGTKKMRLNFCDSCRDRMQREKAEGRQAQYKKCSACPKLKDITTPAAALAHFTPHRQLHAHNVGLLCHTKIMVVDVDVQDDGLSFFNWWAYCEFPEWRTLLHTWVAKTPKGGYHFFFEHDPMYEQLGGNKVLVSPQTKQKVGIDIKIGNCQVLVYPSRVEQGQYQWLRSPGGGPLARIGDTPFAQILQYHGKSILGDAAAAIVPTVVVSATPEAPSDASESDESNDMPSDLRIKTLRTLSLLSRERVADYEGWLNVGFALGRISYTEEMNKIFHKWSREWANYSQEDVDAHWVNCDPVNRPRGYAMAALRRWAQEDNPELFRQLFPDTIPLLDENSKVYFGQLGSLKKKYDHKVTPAQMGTVVREIEEFYRKTVGVVAAKGVLLKLEDEWGWHFEYTTLSEFTRHHTGDAIYCHDGKKELKIEFMDVLKRIKLSELTYSYIKFQPYTPLAPMPKNAAVLNLFTGLAVESAEIGRAHV